MIDLTLPRGFTIFQLTGGTQYVFTQPCFVDETCERSHDERSPISHGRARSVVAAGDDPATE